MTRMKTILTVEVTHEKPLPEKIAETLTYRIGERVHGYLYAQGQQCAVVVRKDRKDEDDAGVFKRLFDINAFEVIYKDGSFLLTPKPMENNDPTPPHD